MPKSKADTMKKTDRLAKLTRSRVALESLGFEYLGSGISRRAYYDKRSKKVFKVGDAGCNTAEWNFYRSLPAKARKLFAKPTQISKCGRVLEMEYVDIIIENIEGYRDDDYDWENPLDHPAITKAMAKLRKLGIEDIVYDIHNGNVGITKSRQVKIVDYACLDDDLDSWDIKQIKKTLKGCLNRKVDGTIQISKEKYAQILSSTE